MTEPLQELRAGLMRAIGSEPLARWRGDTWQAMLTRERYGLHLSVSAQGRLATDEECEQARASSRHRLEVKDLIEVTRAHQMLGALNPYVRHFVPAEQAARMFARAAESQA